MSSLFSPVPGAGTFYQPAQSPGDMKYRNPDLVGPYASLGALAPVAAPHKRTTYAF